MLEFFIVAGRSLRAELFFLAWFALLHTKRRERQLCDKMLFEIAEMFLKQLNDEFMSSVLNQWQAHKDIAKLHGWSSTRLTEETKKWETFVDDQNTRFGKDIERMQTKV